MFLNRQCADSRAPKGAQSDEKDNASKAFTFGPSEAQSTRKTAANSYPASEAAASVAGSNKTSSEFSFGNVRARTKSPDVKINFDVGSSAHGGADKPTGSDSREKKSKPYKDKDKESKGEEKKEDKSSDDDYSSSSEELSGADDLNESFKRLAKVITTTRTKTHLSDVAIKDWPNYFPTSINMIVEEWGQWGITS